MAGFTLKGKIRLDGNDWKAGLDQAHKQADKWGADVASTVQRRLLAAFSLTAALAAARASITQFEEQLQGSKNLVREARRSGAQNMFEGDETDKLAQSIEFIQQLGLSLEQVGMDADRATDILQDLSTRRIEAMDGIAEGKFNDQARALTVLGIAPADLKDTTGPEMLLQLGKNLKGKAATDELKEAMDALFSDAGVDMLVLLREGLQDTMQRMRSEGLIIGGEEVLRRDRVRQKQAIKDRRTQLEIDRANQTGEALADVEREAKLGFFSAIGSPTETIVGTGANLAESIFGQDLSKIESKKQIELEALLNIRELMREVRDNTSNTADHTRTLSDS